VDFTISNGFPDLNTSLHYIDQKGGGNEYILAIEKVGRILEAYDHDKKIPFYGNLLFLYFRIWRSLQGTINLEF
jgi:hypothetical protein